LDPRTDGIDIGPTRSEWIKPPIRVALVRSPDGNGSRLCLP
jgi:hypothetical protein